MALLAFRFDNPFSFAQVQAAWQLRPAETLANKALGLACLEPFWSVYLPSSPAYWQLAGSPDYAIFSLMFANPIYFGGAVTLISVGAARKWLTVPEVLLSIGLLVIPYITRGFEMCMGSQARYAAVVFPMYFVLGRCLDVLPPIISTVLLAFSGSVLAIYSALFAAGYTFF